MPPPHTWRRPRRSCRSSSLRRPPPSGGNRGLTRPSHGTGRHHQGPQAADDHGRRQAGARRDDEVIRCKLRKVTKGRNIMRPKTIGAVSATLCMFSIWSITGMANAAEIKLLASNAIKEAYTEFAPHFEHTSGHKLVTIWAGTVDIMKRMQAGEAYDLVIMAAPS